MYVGHHYAHTHTINVNTTCTLQQTTGKTGTKHRLCEIDVNITNGVIFFTHHEQLLFLFRLVYPKLLLGCTKDV
jgi:hypothetical protein